MISSAVGNTLRVLSRGLTRVGVSLQGQNASVEKLMPSTRVVAIKGQELQHDLEGFVAPTANVVGAVELGNKSSVWYGTVVHGEDNKIIIGTGSSIQDRATVTSVSSAVKIGNDVTIGPGSTVESCTIGDGVLVGPGASIQAGAQIGADSYIDGGAVVTAGTKVPAGELWTGSPAAKLRRLTEDEVAYLRSSAIKNAECAEEHYQQSISTISDLEAQEAEFELRRANFMKWDDAIPEESAVLEEYNRLSYNPHDVGIFRAQDYDEEAEWEQYEAEEDAAAAAADAEAAEVATLERVNIAAEQIIAQHPSRHAEIKARLADRDPVAAELLEEILAQVETASSDKAAATALYQTINADGEVVFGDSKSA